LLLPLDGGSFYRYKDNAWQEVYKHNLSLFQRKTIEETFTQVLAEIGYVQPKKIYGDIIDDRGSQMTWSALGQKAPLEEKEKWNKENNKIRFKIVAKLKEYLPDMEARVAGLTSVDVTLKGIDKKFGIEQVIKYLNLSKTDALFFGDALEADGNDAPALEAGVMCYQVSSIQNTKEAIQYLLS
jgi:HAD superfamily hydrolase (TIGR01484 family)